MVNSAKHWCFTLNNPTDEEAESIERVGERRDELGVTYLIGGYEIGECGTPHVQGFISFAKRKGLAGVKKIISPRVHLECAKGSPKQASDYCKKDGKFQEWGIVPGGQGTRNDLSQAVEAIKKGCSFRELEATCPSAVVRYGSGLLRLQQFHPPKRESPPRIWVFWGKTGVGKTRRVHEFVKREELWIHPGDRWFDGYDRHKAVLFDDFDGSWFKLSYLLKLLDRYEFTVPVKGAYTW